MPKYYVDMREVWIQTVVVEAESREDAIAAAAEGEGEPVDGAFEYSYSLDPDDWNVEEV